MLAVRKRTESEEISQICKGVNGCKKIVPLLYKCDFRARRIGAHLSRAIGRIIWTSIDEVMRISKKFKSKSHNLMICAQKMLDFGSSYAVKKFYLARLWDTFKTKK